MPSKSQSQRLVSEESVDKSYSNGGMRGLKDFTDVKKGPSKKAPKKPSGKLKKYKDFVKEDINIETTLLAVFLANTLRGIPVKEWPQFNAEVVRNMLIDFVKFMKMYGYPVDIDILRSKFDNLLKKALGKLYREDGIIKGEGILDTKKTDDI